MFYKSLIKSKCGLLYKSTVNFFLDLQRFKKQAVLECEALGKTGLLWTARSSVKIKSFPPVLIALATFNSWQYFIKTRTSSTAQLKRSSGPPHFLYNYAPLIWTISYGPFGKDHCRLKGYSSGVPGE